MTKVAQNPLSEQSQKGTRSSICHAAQIRFNKQASVFALNPN